MIRDTLLVPLLLVFSVGFAQTNLVPNPTFEKIGKKIKDIGEIEVAEPWGSPTLALADLYVEKTKNFAISIPENAYGEEKPMKGSGYAGIVAYSYKNKIPRTYLQVQLSKKLEAGKEYCVKYHVSLADLSKYATNHLAVAITKDAVAANNSDVLKFDNFIESKRLKIYEKQFYWVPICGVYKAKGDEAYLTIGNFTEDEGLMTKKVKRPRGFSKPQTNDAYYYVDNVSVIDRKETKKCDCDAIPGMENVETVRKDFSSDKAERAGSLKIINTDGSQVGFKESYSGASGSDEAFDGMGIMFSKAKFSIEKSISKLDKLAAHLKENIDENISILGYIDSSEEDIDKLAGKRVGAVYKYLISKGVKKERIKRKIGGVPALANKTDPTKNMKVEISIVSE